MKEVLWLLLFASMQTGMAQNRGTAAIVPGTFGCGAVTTDGAGNAYLIDEQGIQKYAAGTGKLTTLAHRDLAIDVAGMAADPAGNLYIPQGSHGPLANTVKKLAAGSGAITTVAGTGETYNGVTSRIPGLATKAVVGGPEAVALDSAGNLYIGHSGGVWKLTEATGMIGALPVQIFPTKRGDPVDPIARRVRAIDPVGLAFDSEGNLFVADRLTQVVWQVAPDGGLLKRVAGTGDAGYSGDGGPATEAKLSAPRGVAFDSAGRMFILDIGNNRIRMVAKGSGIISTVAGNGTSRQESVDVPGPDGTPAARYQKAADDGDGGPAIQARLSFPHSMALDKSGALYVCTSVLWKISGL